MVMSALILIKLVINSGATKETKGPSLVKMNKKHRKDLRNMKFSFLSIFYSTEKKRINEN